MIGIAQTMFPAMGTVNGISIRGMDKMNVLDKAKDYVLGLDKALSVFSRDSEITHFNAQSGNWVCLSEDAFHILSDSVHMGKLTGGAFDITSGPLNRIWKRAFETKELPTAKMIGKAKKLVGWQDIELDPASRRARLKRRGMSVDFGGIAKGYAADRLFEMMRHEGIENAMINLGGTVGVLGQASQVGIQNPYRPTGKSLGFLTLENCFAITSGTYERGTDINGKRYHHIIDPRSGEPAQSGLISVTLIGKNATELDALATATLVMGIEKTRPLLQERGIEAVVITDNGGIYLTGGIEADFQLIKQAA